MKRFLYVCTLLFMMVLLVACTNEADTPKTLVEILESVEVEYQTGDSSSSVTKDLILSNESVDGVVITWTSNNTAIKVDGDKGIVTRSETDVSVELVVTATRDDKQESKTFVVTVIKKETVEPEIDLDEIAQGIQIQYQDGDSKLSVSKDVTLPNNNVD